MPNLGEQKPDALLLPGAETGRRGDRSSAPGTMTVEPPRPLEAADRAALLDLWVAAWSAAMPAIDFAARRPWFSGHIDTLLASGAVIVVARSETGEAIAGFFTLHPGTGDLDQLAVDPAFGGRGVARGLLDEAKRLSPAGLRLRVNKANARAMSLYARAGFVVTDETVNARSGLPVWEMAWRLQA